MGDTDFKIQDISAVKTQKPIIIFGKDVREIKCFRNSFIFGICFGVVGGLASFLVTSKTLFSTNIAFATLWVGTFGYWFPCRYKYETNELKVQLAKSKKLQHLEEKIVNETNKDSS